MKIRNEFGYILLIIVFLNLVGFVISLYFPFEYKYRKHLLKYKMNKTDMILNNEIQKLIQGSLFIPIKINNLKTSLL